MNGAPENKMIIWNTDQLAFFKLKNKDAKIVELVHYKRPCRKIDATRRSVQGGLL